MDEENDSDYEYEYEYLVRHIEDEEVEPDPDLDPQPDADPDEPDEPEPDTEAEEDQYNFDEIYEVFRIHTSNVQQANQWGNANGAIACPVCGFEASNHYQIGNHLIYHHPMLFISLTTSLYPTSTLENIQNILSLVTPPLYSGVLPEIGGGDGMRQVIDRLVFNDDTDEAPSYEELMQLCEYIGYHKQGIHNVDNVSTKNLVAGDKSLAPDDTCAICLDTLCSKESVRKIKKCSHAFCSECIEKWFEENKICPLCKTDLDSVDV